MTVSNPETIKDEVKKYYFIFSLLICFALLSVGISYLQIPIALRVFLAIGIAAIQVFFAAGYMMHLLSEKKMILYIVIFLTLFLGLSLIAIPQIETHNPIFGTVHQNVH